MQTRPEIVRALEVYVPPFVQWRLARDPSVPLAPFQDSYSAAIVSADIAGFTALAEQFAAQGVIGAEHVSEILNLLFARLGAVGGTALSIAMAAGARLRVPVEELARAYHGGFVAAVFGQSPA